MSMDGSQSFQNIQSPAHCPTITGQLITKSANEKTLAHHHSIELDDKDIKDLQAVIPDPGVGHLFIQNFFPVGMQVGQSARSIQFLLPGLFVVLSVALFPDITDHLRSPADIGNPGRIIGPL